MTCKDCIHEGVCWRQQELLDTREWDEEQDCCEDKSRYIELPCKVGDRVWHLRGWCDGSFEIAEGKVSMLQQKADKSWKVRISVNSSVWDFTPNEIGTRYFLTKEEAEKALKERS